MKRFCKYLLTLVVALLMVCSLVLPAFAAEIDVYEDGSAYNVTDKVWVLPERDGLSFEINFDRMLSSLQYMWKGMLCIFAVMAVIILSVYVMNSEFGKLDAKKKQKEE